MTWGAAPAQLNTGKVRNGEAMSDGGTGADLVWGRERPVQREGIMDWKICKTKHEILYKPSVLKIHSINVSATQNGGTGDQIAVQM